MTVRLVYTDHAAKRWRQRRFSRELLPFEAQIPNSKHGNPKKIEMEIGNAGYELRGEYDRNKNEFKVFTIVLRVEASAGTAHLMEKIEDLFP